MQQPQNETVAAWSRKTKAGRVLSYRLKVVQEPEKARACGNGPRSSADRRPVDPPPVVKLTIYDGNKDITHTYEAGFMLFAGLEFARPIHHGRMHTNSHVHPVLTGVCVAGAAYLTKPKTAAYFIFPDLSVRHEGWYRLIFHLFEQSKNEEDADEDVTFVQPPVSDLANPRPPNRHESMANRAFVYSAPFQVFSAKKFPGLNTSTELSKIVAEQGCRVRIRRDIRQRKPNKKSKDEEEPRSIQGTPARTLSHEQSPSHESLETRSAHQELTRRVSMESHMSPAYGPSGRPSVEPSLLQSPLTMNHPPATRPHLPSNASFTSYANQVRQPPAPTLPALRSSTIFTPGPHGNSSGRPVPAVPEVSKSQTTSLPSIHHLLDNTSQPPRPRGGYVLPETSATKRSYSPRSYSREPALKDGARPGAQVDPRKSTLDWVHNVGNHSSSGARTLGNAHMVIEADTEPDDVSDSEDSILNCWEYKRANGQRVEMPKLRMR